MKMNNIIIAKRVQVFQAVAQTLSFTRGAELLYMTQPAATFQIRELEGELGTKLFLRESNRVTLTKSGEALVTILNSLNKRIDASSTMFEQLANTSGHEAVTVEIEALTGTARKKALDAVRQSLSEEQLEEEAKAKGLLFLSSGDVTIGSEK